VCAALRDVRGVTDRACEYAVALGGAVPSYPMALAEFRWRNGWFLEQAHTPLHVGWLRRAAVPAELLEQSARDGHDG
jgi:hypothetical protein